MIDIFLPRYFEIFSYKLYLQPLFNILAFAASFFLLLYLSQRYKISKKHIVRIYALILFFGIYLGPSILYFFGPWGNDYGFTEKLWYVFYPFSGGMVYIGGLIAAIIAVSFYLRLNRLDYWRYADFLMIGVPFAQFIGRFGCLAQGCCMGISTDVSWAIMRDGNLIHPTQLYLSLNGLFLFGLIFYLSRKKLYQGTIFCLYFILYSSSRFVIEFFRRYEWRYLGLSLTQYILLILFIVFSIILFQRLYFSKFLYKLYFIKKFRNRKLKKKR